MCYFDVIKNKRGDILTQGDRIKQLRKTLDLTLEKFGNNLGVCKTAISKLEKNERNLTEQMAKAICRTYNVDYTWLTTGEGDMFIDSDEEFLTKLDNVLVGDDGTFKNLFKAMLDLNVDEIKALNSLLDKLLIYHQQAKEEQNKK